MPLTVLTHAEGHPWGDQVDQYAYHPWILDVALAVSVSPVFELLVAHILERKAELARGVLLNACRHADPARLR